MDWTDVDKALVGVANSDLSGRPYQSVPGRSSLTRTGTLMRFVFRRDRVRLSVWAGSIVLTYVYFVVALGAMGQDALNARSTMMQTPAGVMMGGPGFGVGPGLDYTLGIAMANEMILWMTLVLGLQAIMHIVRHTRAEEETSRSELIRASVVGRHAPAVAAFLTLTIVQVGIAVFGALTMHAANSQAMPLTDSFGMTFGVAAAALVFGAAALVASQLTPHPRGATGISLAFLGAMYVLVTAGNLEGLRAGTHGSALSWASPIGWAQQMAPFFALRVWPILLSLAATVLLLVVASILSTHRDYGAGMIADRRGRADALATLRSPFALAWRQQRTSFFAWLIGMTVMWAATGTLMPDVAAMGMDGVANNALFAQIFGTDGHMAAEQFTLAFMGIAGMFVALIFAAFAISTFLRLRTEESSGRLEQLLATPASRSRMLGAQLLVVGIGVTIATTAAMVGMWAGAASAGMTNPGLGDYLLTTASYLAAIAVYLGFAAVLFGWFPRCAQLAWLPVAYTFIVGIFGGVFNAPNWMDWFNPMHWAPAAFDGSLHLAGLIGLVVAAVALMALAFIGFRRRDIPAV